MGREEAGVRPDVRALALPGFAIPRDIHCILCFTKPVWTLDSRSGYWAVRGPSPLARTDRVSNPVIGARA